MLDELTGAITWIRCRQIYAANNFFLKFNCWILISILIYCSSCCINKNTKLKPYNYCTISLERILVNVFRYKQSDLITGMSSVRALTSFSGKSVKYASMSWQLKMEYLKATLLCFVPVTAWAVYQETELFKIRLASY